jgi:N-methylhydantoinase A/oxoprolinase/acetone carboxylase beta subunit
MLAEGSQFEVGVDIGGTFTDVVVAADDGTLSISKIPSSRADPSGPILIAACTTACRAVIVSVVAGVAPRRTSVKLSSTKSRSEAFERR